MPYDDYSDIDSLGDFGPPETGVAQMPAPEVRDFNPRQDIDPLTSKYFQDLDNIRGMSDQDRLKFQTEYLSGVDAIKEQRSKVEQDRRRSMIDELSIQRAQGVLGEARRRQIAAVNATESRHSLADNLKGVMSGDLTDEQRRAAINTFELDNIGQLAADPQMATLLDTARRQIPAQLPLSTPFTPKELQEYGEAQVPPNLLATGDRYIIGLHIGAFNHAKAMASGEAKRITAANKVLVDQTIELTKEPFRFMDEEERRLAGVFSKKDKDGNEVGDTNKYLKPEDHVRARKAMIIYLADTPGAYELWDAIEDDEQKMTALREVQVKALLKSLRMETQSKEERDSAKDDVESERLVP